MGMVMHVGSSSIAGWLAYQHTIPGYVSILWLENPTDLSRQIGFMVVEPEGMTTSEPKPGHEVSLAAQRAIRSRLRRVEGQVRGVQAMVEARRPCSETLTQINAASAALREVSLLLVSDHLRDDLARVGGGMPRDIDVLIALLRKAMRQ